MCCAVRAFREKLLAEGRTFVLAGGLNAENVAEGIRIFTPDVADVSSGVETLCDGTRAKSKSGLKNLKNPYKKQKASEQEEEGAAERDQERKDET